MGIAPKLSKASPEDKQTAKYLRGVAALYFCPDHQKDPSFEDAFLYREGDFRQL